MASCPNCGTPMKKSQAFKFFSCPRHGTPSAQLKKALLQRESS